MRSGYSLFGQQKIGESIRALAKSLELDVTNAEAHKILGRDLMIIGRFDAAQIEFEQAIRYKPDSRESYYNLGKLLSVQDNWEPARKAFESALRIEPQYVEAMDALGFALEALGEDERAVTTYQKAVALNDERHGTFALPHVNLSAYYNRTGDPGKALEYARQRARARSEMPTARCFRRRAPYDRQGRLQDAVEALNRRHRPQPPRIVVLLRPGWRLSASWLDGRQPEGARGVQAARTRDRPSSTRSVAAAGAGRDCHRRDTREQP